MRCASNRWADYRSAFSAKTAGRLAPSGWCRGKGGAAAPPYRNSRHNLRRGVAPRAGAGGADGADAHPDFRAAGQTRQGDGGFRHARPALPTGRRDGVGADLDLVGFRTAHAVPLRVELAVRIAHGEGEVGGLVRHTDGGGRGFDVHARALDFHRVAHGDVVHIRRELFGEHVEVHLRRVAVGHGGAELALQRDDGGVLRVEGGNGRAVVRQGRVGRGKGRVAGHRGLDVAAEGDFLFNIEAGEVQFNFAHVSSRGWRRVWFVVKHTAVIRQAGGVVVSHIRLWFSVGRCRRIMRRNHGAFSHSWVNLGLSKQR